MGVVTLTGSNSYLISQTLRNRIDSFKALNSDMAIERFDADETEAAYILSSLNSTSLFSEKKLVMLKGITKNSELSERVEELVESAKGDDTQLIIIEPKLDKRGKLYLKLKKSTDYTEFSDMRASALISWLVKEAVNRGGKISSSTAKHLVDNVGANQELLSSELDKLLIYDPNVTDANVDLLIEASPQSKIYHLVDAVFRSDKKRIAKLYEEQRALKVDPNQIVGFIAWQLHLLAAIKTSSNNTHSQIAKDLGVRIEAVDNSARLASSISLLSLVEMINRLLSVDRKLKQQAINKDDALLFCLLSL